jgi:hypothetical protein
MVRGPAEGVFFGNSIGMVLAGAGALPDLEDGVETGVGPLGLGRVLLGRIGGFGGWLWWLGGLGRWWWTP